MAEHKAWQYVRSIDLDVDIGADAVDYNAIAKQESLSGLEVEMRKLEGVVKEIVDELNYLKRREARMRDTNGELFVSLSHSGSMLMKLTDEKQSQRTTELETSSSLLSQHWSFWEFGRLFTYGVTSRRVCSHSLFLSLQAKANQEEHFIEYLID